MVDLLVKLPEKQPALRVMPMPADVNQHGDVFGGWIMSQMDIGGAILAKEMARGRVVTVAVDAITFLKPVTVGDVVCCYAHCIRTGRSSITVNMEVWVKKVSSEPIGQRYCVTEAIFTYVAVSDEGKSRALPDGKRNYTAE